jgi:hypothetical protein
MKAVEVIPSKQKSISLDRRLRIDRLPKHIRSYAAQVVVVALIMCLIIVLYGLGLYPAESTIVIPENFSPTGATLALPFSLILLVLVGLGIVFGALFYASYQPGWKLRLPTRLTIGTITLALPLFLLNSAGITSGTGNLLGLVRIAFVLLAVFLGVSAVICAFLSSPRISRWAGRFTTGSFFCVALAFLTFKPLLDSLSQQGQINLENSPQIFLPLIILITYVTPLVYLVGFIFFWQALTEAKIFTRDIGIKIADFSERIPWLLAVLFAVKLIWILGGYGMVMGGVAVEPWKDSWGDGILAWALAGIFALATGWWLAYWRKPAGPDSFTKPALFLTIGFLFAFIAASLTFALTVFFTLTGLEGIGSYFYNVSSQLADNGLIWPQWFVALLIPLGIVLLRSIRFRGFAPVLLLAGLWSFPPLIQQLFGISGVSFEYLTFDVLLTFTLLALAVLAWRGKQHEASIWVITLVLVVSSLVALAESIIPSGYAYLTFTILLVLPVLYQLFFDSTELNDPDLSPGERVIRVFGLQAGLMIVIAWAVVLGLNSPQVLSFEDVANKLFLTPILALLLAHIISEHEGVARQSLPEIS